MQPEIFINNVRNLLNEGEGFSVLTKLRSLMDDYDASEPLPVLKATPGKAKFGPLVEGQKIKFVALGEGNNYAQLAQWEKDLLDSNDYPAKTVPKYAEQDAVLTHAMTQMQAGTISTTFSMKALAEQLKVVSHAYKPYESVVEDTIVDGDEWFGDPTL